MPYFSVVIPTYNRREFLSKAVESVLEQTFKDFELIVVDDGSTDGTERLIKKYPDKRITYLYQENRGVSRARNRGIKEAAGKYIAFLDSDDWWLEEKLEITRKAIEDNPDYGVFHTQEKWYRNGQLLNQKKRHRKPTGYVFKRCLKLCCISISTAVVERDLFDKIGMFDENLPACEDYDFWLRVAAGHPVYLIDRVLTEKEGGHAGQQSQKYMGMDRFRVRAITKIMDSGNLSQKQYKNAFTELKRKCNIYANGCFKRDKKKEGQKYIEIIKDYAPE
ncbi:MAG: glycosyltransferase family 2 protein [Elusimicrobiota bacterium]